MAEAAPGEQLIVARVGDRLIGLPVAQIVQVLPMLPLWRPPTLPRPLAGFVSTRGGVMAVLDAHRLFGVERARAPSLYAHILELGTMGQSCALLVDRAEGFATPKAIGAVEPEGSLNGCAVGLFQFEGTAIAHLVAPERLLGLAERERLADLTAEADRRRAEWADAA